MRTEGECGEAVGLTWPGIAVAVATMITSSEEKGLQAEAINRNPAMTKSFLWIIVLPLPSLSLRTKRFSLSTSLYHDAGFGTKLLCSKSTWLTVDIQDL
jgi:hypothetical protein